MGLAEQEEAAPLAKTECSGTSNHYQTLPLLAKKPWWSMVVGGRVEARPIGRHSAVREAREPRQIRAPVLILNSKVVAGKSAPWRACRPKSPQSNPCSPNVCKSLCGAPGAHRAAMWASPARQNSTPGGGTLVVSRK